MKWFKHETDAHTNLKLQTLIRDHGAAAYGYYWFLIELVGKEGDNFRIISGKSWNKFAEIMLQIDSKKQQEYLDAIADLGLIDKKALKQGTLYIPKLAERSDDYTNRVRRVSEHSSDNVPLEENRTEEIRTEKRRISSFEDILKHPLWETIKTKYPDRDYRYQFNLMMDWWSTHKRKKPQNITAFTNWLNNTKPDLSLQSARLSELSKVEDRKKQEELAKIKPPSKETMDKLRANINNFKKNVKTI